MMLLTCRPVRVQTSGGAFLFFFYNNLMLYIIISDVFFTLNSIIISLYSV